MDRHIRDGDVIANVSCSHVEGKSIVGNVAQVVSYTPYGTIWRISDNLSKTTSQTFYFIHNLANGIVILEG